MRIGRREERRIDEDGESKGGRKREEDGREKSFVNVHYLYSI